MLNACMVAIFYDRYDEGVMQETLMIPVQWWKEGRKVLLYNALVDSVETTDTEIRAHALLR